MKKALIIIGLSILAGVIVITSLYYLLPVALVREDPREPIQRISPTGVEVETVADNLDIPWAIDFADNGDIFFTERSGSVRMIRQGQLVEQSLLDLERVDGEGGTLGIALDPEFSKTQHIYIYYTTRAMNNRVSRFEFAENKLTSETVLLDSIPGASTHNGGRIAFGPEGHLYIGTGDAEDPDAAQDVNSLAGKILRINRGGDIPSDNPFPNSAVYSIGHRNVQGLDWDDNGALHATEHGPQARDEINRISPGKNYGWPHIAGNLEAGEPDPVENYQDPLISSGGTTWAPSGMSFYINNVLPPEWSDSLLFAGLRSQSLWRYQPQDGSLVALLSDEYGRLRDVAVAPDGTVYLLTSNRDGRALSTDESDDRILRIVPLAE